MKTKLITITLVSLAAVLVTVPFFTVQAYFSDTESSLFIFSTSDFSSSQRLSEPEQPSSTTTAVTFSAGIVDIAVNGHNPWFETYEFTSMTPGLWGETDINIANIGNNPVTYKISAEWDSSSSPSSQYLFNALQVEIFDARGNLITSVDQFLKDLDTPSHFLAASGEELLKFKVKLRGDAGTEYQNLITKFNLIIIATQIIDQNALIVEFEGVPLFNEANFSPSQSVTRWVKVTNNSGQPQRIATEAINVSDPYQLGDVLNLEIKEGGVTKYNNTFSKFYTAGEVYLSDLAPGSSTLYNFSISFYPEASNVFQGKSLSFDILVGFQGTSSGGAGGYFSDAEINTGNVFQASTLDFSLRSDSGDFSPDVIPAQTSSRNISVVNEGSLVFKYTVQTANAIGSLCNYLSLAADLDGNNKYNGPLTSFNYNVGEFSAPEDWIFAVSLTNNDAGLQNRTCTFDFIYNGTQVSGAGFSDVETISNTVTAGTWEVPRIFPDKAAELAKEVIEAPYLWGGKGYDFGEMKFATSLNIKESGYYYWDPNEQKIDFGKGLDCAGVSFWGYNRAYYKDQIVNWGKCAVYGHECPIGWEGANEQCIYNIEDNAGKYCQYKELNKDQLRPGDLLFFDAEIRKNGKFVRYGQDGVVDHVAMYMGPSWYEGKYYDVIEATIWKNKIITTTVDAIIERIRDLAGEKAFVRSGHVIETKKPEMKIIAHSPVDLIITDPTGVILTQEEKETIGMSYYEYDIDEDGKLDDIINIAIREIGDYLIQVVPHPDALLSDTYSLTVEALVNGETVIVVLTENVPISEIPRAPYILSSTETEIIPIIPAFIDFDPDTLNLKSQGEFVTTYIELPEGYEFDQIDIPSIMLNDLVLALTKPTEIGDYDNNGTFDLMVKFDRSGVQSILSLGDEVNLTLTGKVFYNGNYIDFKGSDMIRVVDLGGLKDYVPEPKENKPDGTIQYYDENGNLKEKWLPPEQIEELLKKGGSKRLYKVLIKGSWDGVKEALWELSHNNVEKFVDEKDYAYAVCSYEKGELKYVLTKKKIWDNMEEVGKTLMNPNLSKEQQIEEIKKLAKD